MLKSDSKIDRLTFYFLRDPEITSTTSIVVSLLSQGAYLAHVPEGFDLKDTAEHYARKDELRLVSSSEPTFAVPQVIPPASLPWEIGRNHAEMLGAEPSNILSAVDFAKAYDSDVNWAIFPVNELFFIQLADVWDKQNSSRK